MARIKQKKKGTVKKKSRRSANPTYHIKKAKKALLQKIGDKYAQKFTKKLKRDKKKLQKELTTLQREYNKL